MQKWLYKFTQGSYCKYMYVMWLTKWWITCWDNTFSQFHCLCFVTLHFVLLSGTWYYSIYLDNCFWQLCIRVIKLVPLFTVVGLTLSFSLRANTTWFFCFFFSKLKLCGHCEGILRFLEEELLGHYEGVFKYCGNSRRMLSMCIMYHARPLFCQLWNMGIW